MRGKSRLERGFLLRGRAVAVSAREAKTRNVGYKDISPIAFRRAARYTFQRLTIFGGVVT